MPVWQGSYLPFAAAMRRWAFPDVWTVMLGSPTVEDRRRLVQHIRDHPPLGMFDVDADADALNPQLPLRGFVVHNAAIVLDATPRDVDRQTGLDLIGLGSEDESAFFDIVLAGRWDEDLLTPLLLSLLARNAGRRISSARVAHGYEALVDQAFELFGLGAVGASGAVAGVAFEQLMRAALVGSDREWLHQHSGHVKLNDVIGKVASAGGWNDGRLRKYQHLRNDLAHRLGDQQDVPRDDGALTEAVDEILRWLDQQTIDENGIADLTDVAPPPTLSYDELLAEAHKAGDDAASAARTTAFQIDGERAESLGYAWVIVPDSRRPFTRWLLESSNARTHGGGALISAPAQALERNLAWAHAFAMRVRQAGFSAHYAGRAD